MVLKKFNHFFFASFSLFSAVSSVLFFSLLILLYSCAQVVAPGGGKRDEKAPRVVKYTPDSAQLNFTAKTIDLDFDEYIQLKDLNSQLLISPPFEKTPEIKVKNKSLSIDLSKEELKPNTTYSINFGNAIQDINEGNPIENFKYIFSTGAFIDSLSLKGKVQFALDHKTEKGVLVMLYSDTNDSAIYLKQPDYFGKTEAGGTFEITNIRPGKYKIYALKDANSNYKYDGEPESIAFVEGMVDPSEKKAILLELFQEASSKVFIKKYSHPSYGKIVLVFNQGSDSIHISNLSNDRKGVQEFTEFSKTKDTLTYWVKNYDKDSLKLQVSNGNSVIDTLEFKMIKLEDALKAKRNPLKLTLLNNFNGNQSVDLNSLLSLNFSNPITSVNERVSLQDTIRTTLLSYDVTILNRTKVSPGLWDSTAYAEDPHNPGTFISTPIKSSTLDLHENTKYHLLILPGTFKDIFGLANDSIKIDFKTKEQKFYGTLKLKIASNETAIKGLYIVQLIDERDNVIRTYTVSKTETLNFEYLYPNKYRLKLIYDENGNGKWDSGNYLKKIQPEKVIYNAELITIRSNWDADIEWKVQIAN